MVLFAGNPEPEGAALWPRFSGKNPSQSGPSNNNQSFQTDSEAVTALGFSGGREGEGSDMAMDRYERAARFRALHEREGAFITPNP